MIQLTFRIFEKGYFMKNLKLLALIFIGAEILLHPSSICAQENTITKENNSKPSVAEAAISPNQWVMLDQGSYGKRGSVGIVYLPEEKSFLMVGGYSSGKEEPYDELTFNMKESRWENRFPIGKEGIWGDVTGVSKAPTFPYGSSGFVLSDGVFRSNLTFGYNHKMEIWGNAAYDKARGKVVVPFHRMLQTYEYDPKARVWTLLDSAKSAPYTFWDDIVFGRMCYDPLNKEVLAGQGRWALRNGQWESLHFGSEQINSLRNKGELLAIDIRSLLGACRARFYMTESEKTKSSKLDETAKAIIKLLEQLITEIKSANSKVNDYEKRQLLWATESAEKALEIFKKNQDILKGAITKEIIAALEEGWEALDDLTEDLAVVPPKRAYCTFAVDEKRGKIILFGGHRLDRVLADTWIYDCKTRTWEQPRPKISPSPRYGHGLVWLPKSGKTLLVDGAGKSESWVYDIDTNEWNLLDEGTTKRDSLVSQASTWGWQPEPAVADENDFVLIVANRNESKIPRFSTWGATFDTNKINAEATKKQGVPFRTEDFGWIKNHPQWYEQNAGEINPESQKEWIDSMIANTWKTKDRKTQKNNPNENRAWGTSVYDPHHDQILQWGGGHVAYTGNSVLHYSLTSDQFYITLKAEDGLKYVHGQGGMIMSTTYRNRAFMTGHSYRSYGYDITSGILVVCGQTKNENSNKESFYFGYVPEKNQWLPTPIKTPFDPHYGIDRICTTEKGLVAWAAAGGFWKYDVAASAFVAMPLSGEKLKGGGHESHGIVYDNKRNRIAIFSQHYQGEAYSYDMESGNVIALNPKGKEQGIKFECRELVYIPEADMVLFAAPTPDAEGKLRWPLYDCEKNEWKSILIEGNDPVGKRYSVSIGLMYDTKRKLVWVFDNTPNVSALKIDWNTANIQPFTTSSTTKDPNAK